MTVRTYVSMIVMCIASLAFITTAYGEEAETAAEAPADTGVRVVGKAVLPEDYTAEDVDWSKSQAGLMRLCTKPLPELPEGWDAMDGEAKDTWLREWAMADEANAAFFKDNFPADGARPTFLDLAEDGVFEFKQLKPGLYRLQTMLALPVPEADADRIEAIRGLAVQYIQVPHDAVGKIQAGALPPQVVPKMISLDIKVGDLAPDFEYQDIATNEQRKLSDLRGGFVLVDFWATWCGPCIRETPNLIEAHNQFAERGLTVLGVSIDDEIEKPAEYAKSHEVPYSGGFLGAGEPMQQVLSAYGIKGIPSIWLIGPDGKVVAKNLRGERTTEAIEKALSEAEQAPQ